MKALGRIALTEQYFLHAYSSLFYCDMVVFISQRSELVSYVDGID